MSGRRFVTALILIGALAAGVRFAHLASIRGTPLYGFDRVWVSSDMHTHRAWAEHLASGDWLDRDAYRPRFDWQDGVADPATWARWLGPTTYYQPPLYPYLVAASVRATGSPDAIRWLQAFLGAVNVVLIGLLGRRVAGAWAGLVAALLAAGYAPFVMYDGELLRGTLVMALNLLALLALHAAGAGGEAPGSRGGENGSRGRWILAGAALGVVYLADSAVVTFLPLAFIWAIFAPGGRAGADAGRSGAAAIPWRPGLPRAGWLAVGFVAALIPLLARNALVGAPLFSTTTRAPLAFVMGNAPGTRPVGAVIPEGTAGILRASDYRVGATIVETIRAHRGAVGALLGMQWEKLAGLFNGYEVPDNPSFYYAALHSPWLAYGMRFSCISGLGLLGLILAARRLRENMLMYLYVAGFLSLFLMAHVVSRYRQPLVAPLAIYAGYAVVEAARAAGARRFLPAAGILAGGVALSFALPNAPPPGYRYYRPAEFVVAAGSLEAEGDVTRAGAEIRRALVLAVRENAPAGERISLGVHLGDLYLRHERYPEALDAFRDVVEEDPRNPDALAAIGAIHQEINHPMEALEYLLRAEKVNPDNPEVQARLGHLYWFTFHDGKEALPHIRKALDLAPGSPAARSLSDLASEIAAATGLNP